MKRPKLWDGISSILVLFGLGCMAAAAGMVSGRWYMLRLGASFWACSSLCAPSAARFVTATSA